MLGSLIPCDGGPPIGLSKPKLALKLRTSSSPDGLNEGRAELLLTDGVWTVTKSGDGPPLRINDVICETTTRLLPNDILTVGRHRYRITYHYHPPHQAPPPPVKPKPVAQRPPTSSHVIETPVLGMLIPCAGGKAILLRKPRIVIGRAKDCDVVLPSASVSGRHCQLDLVNGHWQMTDLDSRNGTFVDAMRYRSKWMFPGNVLGLSSMRFRLEYVPEGDRPNVAVDDEPVLSKRSLMACAGMSDGSLEAMPEDVESTRKRWIIE